MRRISGPCFLFLLAVCLGTCGCNTQLGKGTTCPNVRVTYRGSIVTDSLVIEVTNAGAKPIFNVAVSNQKWSKRYLIANKLKPGESVEAGWLELPEGLQSGDQVQISAEGYMSSYDAKLP